MDVPPVISSSRREPRLRVVPGRLEDQERATITRIIGPFYTIVQYSSSDEFAAVAESRSVFWCLKLYCGLPVRAVPAVPASLRAAWEITGQSRPSIGTPANAICQFGDFCLDRG